MKDLNESLSPGDKESLLAMQQGYSPESELVGGMLPGDVEPVIVDQPIGRTPYDDLESDTALGLEDAMRAVSRLNRSRRNRGKSE